MWTSRFAVRMPDGEWVQVVHDLLEPHRVDRPIGVSFVRLDDLQDAGAQALPGASQRGPFRRTARCPEHCRCRPGRASGSRGSPASTTRSNGAASRPRPERIAPVEYSTSGIGSEARQTPREGETPGEHPLRARCSPLSGAGWTTTRRPGAGCGTCTAPVTHGTGALCVPHNGDDLRRHGSVSRAHAIARGNHVARATTFWTAWPAKPAATEVVAHATLPVPQPEASSSDSRIEAALRARRSAARSSAVARSLCGSQLVRSRRCAPARFRSARAAATPTRTVRALGAPAARGGGLDPASRDPCPGNYRPPRLKCLTAVGVGATVGSSSPAATRSPSTSPGVEHVRIGGFRPRFVLRFSTRFSGCLLARRHVREADNRIP